MRSQQDTSSLCTSLSSIPQLDPFLLPLCHDILALSQLAALASPGHPPLAAGRTVWKFLPANSLLEMDISSSHIPTTITSPTASPSPFLRLPAPSWWDSEQTSSHLLPRPSPGDGRGDNYTLEIIQRGGEEAGSSWRSSIGNAAPTHSASVCASPPASPVYTVNVLLGP